MYQEETTNLYIEKKDRCINSAIRLDDFEVFLRQRTYKNTVTRPARKLINQIKWLPFAKRIEMWKGSRKQIFDYRQKAMNERSLLHLRVSEDIKKKLERFNITDEKALQVVTERYVFHLRETAFMSRVDQIQRSH